MPFKTPLEAAIAHLISKGQVKSYADVARDLKSARSTVTNYANKGPISDNFKTMFENHYGLKLADFEPDAASPPKKEEAVPDNLKDEMIALQRKQIELHEKYAALMEKRHRWR